MLWVRSRGFKGPASSWVSPAQRGTAGAGWEGEPKDRSLSLSSASPDWGAERGCRPEGRGLGGKNETGKRQDRVFRRQDQERCWGRFRGIRAWHPPLPTLAELI